MRSIGATRPTISPTTFTASWVAPCTLLTARAIENTCYVAAAAQNGKKYSGLSQVIDPQGVPVASVGEVDGFAIAEIDPIRLAEVRKRNPSLQNRRFTVSPR